MKIIFDFDGTLTDITHEHQFVLHFYEDVFETRFGIHPKQFQHLYRTAHERIFSEPEKHGWLYGGRMSAYCDEDLFMDCASVMTLLDVWKDDPPRGFEEIFQKTKGVSFIEIAEQAHEAMREQPLTPLNTPEAGSISMIQRMIKNGDEVVIVSNSSTDIIMKKCKFAGLDPVDHERDPSAQFRVRGQARKYQLDDTPDLVTFGSRTVDVARSSYRKIIEDEHPQFILGDVFSLDLALPITMARKEPSLYNDMQVYLIRRPYTSPWATEYIQNTMNPNATPFLSIIQRHIFLLRNAECGMRNAELNLQNPNVTLK